MGSRSINFQVQKTSFSLKWNRRHQKHNEYEDEKCDSAGLRIKTLEI